MDYDEKDLQSQNLRLDCEGANSVRPFALPRIDFDDILQGHLRFDSLVETGVFLGIESQEDNWIDDFSRGSSGIVFNSCTAESCSISRSNNAWFEATSSESVEMLLKSVGQEEFILEQTTKESDMHDERGNLTKQVVPTSIVDDNTLRKADLVDSGPASSSDMPTENIPQSNEDVSGDPVQINDIVQIHVVMDSCATFPTSMPIENIPQSSKDVRGDPVLIDCTIQTHDGVDSGATFPACMPIESSPQSNEDDRRDSVQIDGIGQTHDDDSSAHQSQGNLDLITDVGGASNVLSDQSSLDSRHLGIDDNNAENVASVISGDHSIVERNVAEIITKDMRETSSMASMEESDLQVAEGSKVDARTPLQVSRSEALAMSNINGNIVQHEEGTENDLPMSLESPCRFEEGHEFCKPNMENSCSLELDMDLDARHSQSAVGKKNVNLLESDNQVGSEIPASNSEASLLSLEYIEVLKLGNAKSALQPAVDTHSTLSCASSDLNGRKHEPENPKDLHESSGIFKEELCSGVPVSPTTCGDMPVGEKDVVSGQASVHNNDHDDSGIKREAALPVDVKNVEYQAVGSTFSNGMLGSSCLGIAVKDAGSLAPQDVVANDNASDNKSSEKFSPLDVMANDNASDNKFSEKFSPLIVRSPNLDKSEETGTLMSTNSNSSNLKDCSEDRNFLHAISRGEREASSNDRQLACETVNPYLPLGSSPDAGSHGHAHEGVSKDSQEPFEELNDYDAKTVSLNNAEEPIFDQGEMSTLPAPSSPKHFGQEADQASLATTEGNCCPVTVLKNEGIGDALNAPESYPSTACLLESNAKSTLFDGGNVCRASEKPNFGPPTLIGCAGSQHVDELQDTDSLSTACLPESEAESDLHKDESGCEGSEKTNCGSPTIVSCVDGQHWKVLQAGDKGPADENVICGVNGDNKVACSTSPKLKGDKHSKVDNSFTFEMTSLHDSSEGVGKNFHASATIQIGHVSEVVDVSYDSTPSQMDSKTKQETTMGNSFTDSAIERGSFSTDRKLRRASDKLLGKEAAKNVNYLKEAGPVGQKGGDKPHIVPSFQSAASHFQQPEKMLHCGLVDWGGTKPIDTFTNGTSSLPDLNASASSPVLFQQPFTDMQQLQLRTQIFVYGSLILGAAPDETCMVTAFGSSEAGRRIWENAWRTCVERAHHKKSQTSNPESPLSSSSVAQSFIREKDHAAQSKAISTPVGRACNKVPLSPVGSCMMATASPLWSISSPSLDSLHPSAAMPRGGVLDYHPPFSPLNTYQSRPSQNFAGHASWPRQVPFQFPWISPQQTSASDAPVRLSTLPVTETLRLTPFRELSVPHSSGLKHFSSSLTSSTGASGGAHAGNSSPIGIKMASVSHGDFDQKSRKRKKIPIPADPSIIASPSASVVATRSACSILKTDSSEVMAADPPPQVPVNERTVNQDVVCGSAPSEESLNNVKVAKMQAEEAAVHAAAAVCHSQEIWCQLDKQKNSGLVSDVQAALTSAAVAVAASASIAKAAAAAAKIASNVALQSKLMADEALHASGNGNCGQTSGIYGSAETGSPSSVIGAARVAARKRVEAASAASKQAENFDALIKSAELAAEAVCQAAKVVAMGDPLPLIQLAEAGPVGFWKFTEVSSDLAVKSYVVEGSKLNVDTKDRSVEEGLEIFVEHSERHAEKMEMPTTSHSELLNSDGELRGQEGRNLAKLEGAGQNSEFGPGSAAINVSSEYEHAGDTLKVGSIKEGSLVEVFKNNYAYKAAWYLANVLIVEEGKLYVCYTGLKTDDGSGLLKEWIKLEGEGESAPRVRIARPWTASQVVGTRKRQRQAMEECTYSVGDRVDAWLRTCWREGVITEILKNDGSIFTVSFPAEDERSTFRDWHLRPSFVWKDGEWVDWFGSVKNSPHEADASHVKRPRFIGPEVESGDGKLSKNINLVESVKPHESLVLPFSGDERLFDAGKASIYESKPDSDKTVETGSQKQGPRVMFGVPKAKKKRKFMDVSKHFLAGQSSKTIKKSDTDKRPRVLLPRGSGSRGASRLEMSERQPPESKLRPRKAHNISSRIVAEKNKSSTSATSAHNGMVMNGLAGIEDSDNHDENSSGRHNVTGFGSFGNKTGGAGRPLFFSPSKKVSTASNSRSEDTNKGKLVRSTGKLAKIDEDRAFMGNSDKATSEVMEPRRSSRRIQPTSRLLEGLQSSMVISKLASQERSQKGQSGGGMRE